MKNLIIKILFIGFSIGLMQGCYAGAEENVDIKIYLPRSVRLSADEILLGDVAVIQAQDETAGRLKNISLGRFALPGQNIVFDRATIMSRIAAAGIDTKRIEFSGSDAVSAVQRSQQISAEQITAIAESLLKKNTLIGQITPVGRIKPVILSEDVNNLHIIAKIVEGESFTNKKAIVSICDGNNVLANCELNFRVRYNSTELVAAAEIAAGQQITNDNARTRNILIDYPPISESGTVFGMVAKLPIKSGQVIRSDMTVRPQSAVMVAKNQAVQIRLQKGPLLITAVGKALSDGRAGDVIKVENADSHRTIVVKVRQDGSVEPVL